MMSSEPDDARPLNIWSRSDEEIGRLMSHFAHTPFTLDGVEFGSVEAFYTWLVVSGDPDRQAKVAPMWGARAKRECPQGRPDLIDYHGRTIDFGSDEHHELVLNANRAKLAAYPEIAHAFLATAPRPIVHILPGHEDDPQEAFCRIMRQLRDELAQRVQVNVTDEASAERLRATLSPPALLGVGGESVRMLRVRRWSGRQRGFAAFGRMLRTAHTRDLVGHTL
jgi:predicted NAD-dependent protein-ADP-ribosyltransferase YbiA (DUF1768 family)